MGREEIFHLPCTDPQFLARIFWHLIEEQKEHPLSELFDLGNEAQLCLLFDASGIQDSLRFRALNRARKLSAALIDEKGDLKRDFLKKSLSWIEKEGFIFYPNGGSDGSIQAHLSKVLKALDTEEAVRSLKRFQKPLCHRWAEKLVFETLGIPPSGSLTDAQIKIAVLCAALTPLRQNVGSCFATAPAILIQSDQVLLFLEDLYQLLSTGKLKRTFGGVEYAIPLSPSTGIGDLNKNLISKDVRVKAGYCPGLIAALNLASALEKKTSFQEWGESVELLIQEYGAGKNQLTVGDLIRQILLRKFSLSSADLEMAKSLEIAQFKSSKMTTFAPDPGIARKIDQISSFQMLEKECRSVFKAQCDNSLLKAWEFTLASYSEVKMEFSRWNLYSSLGLSPNEPGGLGEMLYRRIDEKITEINKKLEKAQADYEIAFDQLRATESLLRNVSSESEGRRLQGEYQSRSYHMRSCLELRDALYSKGSNYSNLYSYLVKQYDQKFPEYFQEIYDAEMQDVSSDLYDDSPAGFRLVYKHGRTDPSLWTLIYDAQQYIDALLEFFSVTEAQVAVDCEWEGGSDDVLELTAAIANHIRDKEFLASALRRMTKAHHNAMGKKPWAYTSGGTMTTLLKTYFCRETELSSEEKWVESETELLIFIIDTLKNLPPNITDPLLKGKATGMLMASPTHAFILLPAQKGFHQGWQEDMFTYTWVRDEVFLPSQKFYAQMRLNPSEQNHLLAAFSEKFGSHLEPIFSTKQKDLSVIEWRNQILDTWIRRVKPVDIQQKQTLSDGLDSFLFQSLPLVEGREWKAIVRRILSDRMNDRVEEVLARFSDRPAAYLTSKELKEAAMGCYLLAEAKLALFFDLHCAIAEHARYVGAAQPTPLLFADTNWTGNYFGFVVNPGTGKLELWRLDKSLSHGIQMSEWKQYLNGVDRKTWSIYTRPYEYTMLPPSIHPSFK